MWVGYGGAKKKLCNEKCNEKCHETCHESRVMYEGVKKICNEKCNKNVTKFRDSGKKKKIYIYI